MMSDVTRTDCLIPRIVIWALAVLLTPSTHKILWQWINGRIDRASIAAGRESLAAVGALGFGALSATYLWPKITGDLPKTFLYDVGWGVVTWLGGMVALSLVELFNLWQEHKGSNE